jgi:heme/copper-type cytochrome/quinol oxidase subunit 2
LTSNDVTHGFQLDAFGISAVITPGKITTVNFIAGAPGTYTFYCSVFCGSGHTTMKGTLIVLPSDNSTTVGSGNTNFFSFFNVMLMLGFVFATGLLFVMIKSGGR